MKFIFTFSLLLINHLIFAQADKDLIFKNWVKTNLQYKNGEELSDDQQIKFSYIRYSFEKPNKVFISFNFNDKGTSLTFNINNKILEIKNSFGIVSNSFLIEEITKDELTLIQKGQHGFDEPNTYR